MEPANRLIRNYRLHGGRDKTSIYIVDGLMLDCGAPRMRRKVESILKTHTIEQAALSHYHEQHSGNAALLNEKGFTPFLSAKGIEQLKDGFPPQLLYRRWAYGTPARARFQPMPAEIRTHRLVFQVIPTPGHSDDHVCFYEPNEQWLFAGDMYMGSFFHYSKREENIHALIRAYETLKALPIKVMYCSHIGAISDPQFILENKWFSLSSFRDLITAMKNRGMGYDRIRKALKLKEGWLAFLTQGDKAKSNFIHSVLRDEHL